MNTDNRPPPYSMRLDPDLRAKLEAIAKANGRSLHAEISMRLGATLKDDVQMDNNVSQEPQVFPLPDPALELEVALKRQKFLEQLELNRQQREKDLRDPAKQAPIIEIEEGNDLRSSILANTLDVSLRRKEQERLLSETEYEFLVREAVGALELRRIEKISGFDDFKYNPASKGLPRSLMNTTDLGVAVEDTVLRMVCILFHDVLQKKIPALILKELANAGIVVPGEQSSQAKSDHTNEG